MSDNCDSGFTTCYAQPTGGYVYAGGGQGGQNTRVKQLQVVKDEWGSEKWALDGNKNITQPDPERQALSGTATVDQRGKPIRIHYTYGDELPTKIVQATLCAVLCSVIATPLALICIIPMILKFKKVWYGLLYTIVLYS